MKAVVFLFFVFFSAHLFAQETSFTPPRFSKQSIGTSGCFAYLPATDSLVVDVSYSPDSAAVYTVDQLSGDFHYAVIVVKLHGTTLSNLEEKEDMLTAYMDFLQGSFSISDAAGYGKGHTLASNPDATGIIDYWIDVDGDNWEVKGWADSTTLAIMMVYGGTEYPNHTTLQVFLDGFRFN
jgi:hypothetical protein